MLSEDLGDPDRSAAFTAEARCLQLAALKQKVAIRTNFGTGVAALRNWEKVRVRSLTFVACEQSGGSLAAGRWNNSYLFDVICGDYIEEFQIQQDCPSLPRETISGVVKASAVNVWYWIAVYVITVADRCTKPHVRMHA